MQTNTAANTAAETETLFLAAQAGEKYLRALTKVSEAKAHLAKMEREENEGFSFLGSDRAELNERRREAEEVLHYAIVRLNGWASTLKSFAKDLV
jgi:hypothetical protein